MKEYLSLVKFSHTVFALPFALVGYFLAVHQPALSFDWATLGLVILCMVFARNAAMGYNRYLDRDIDEANPRTAVREIPAGKISPTAALAFVIVNCILFVATTFFINDLCFYLSPVALVIILGYSYTKRVTFLCHFVLGLGLALAPIGAYLAVGGGWDLVPLLLGGVVLFWVSGFDIIYSMQDEEFDRFHELNSVPVKLGKVGALNLSTGLHAICAILMTLTIYFLRVTYPEFAWLVTLGGAIFIGLLAYQHTLVKPKDLSKVNLAFFTTNGISSVVFGACLILDLYF